jgi:alkylation response protein AidB-like acyl-CoA dehydrogenase
MSDKPVNVPEDLAEFRAYVADWLSSHAIPGVAEDLDVRFDELRAWQKELYDAGMIAIAWPKEWGGRGLSVFHQQAFTDELAAARAPQPIGLIGLDVVGPSIAQFASDELRDRLMGPLLSGEEIWCQGFSEPAAGSDLAALRTRAVRDGDEFVVTGQKTWTSWAHKAARCALLARSDPDSERHRGISYLVVDMDSPGITVRPIVQATGETEFSEVFFEEVRVPVSNLIGELHGGWRIAMDTLGHERGGFALRRRVEISAPFDDSVAALRAGLDEGGATPPDWVLEEVGRGRVALRSLQAQTGATLERIADHGEPSAIDSVDKLVLSQVEQEVFGSLERIVGPFGSLSELELMGVNTGRVTRDYLYGLAGSIYGGTAQIQRNIVSERMLGMPRS